MSFARSLDTVRIKAALKAAAAQVEKAMHADLEQSLATFEPLLGEVLRYSLFSGGKRIRPFLCVLASRCCGRDDQDLYTLAASLEYVHTASLLQDDVLDHAPLRRGVETTFKRYSLADAMLAGDWLHAHSMRTVSSLTGAVGVKVICTATSGMVNGEYLQKRLSGDRSSEEESYFSVIKQKTANLLAASCALGALYAGVEQRLVQAMADYGELVGMAFQIIDDLLDYIGLDKDIGKEVGNDFREGKMTLPLIRALWAANASERQEILALMANKKREAQAWKRMYALVESLGGFSSAAQTASDFVERAVQALAPFAPLPAAAPHLELLRDMANLILTRKK